LAFVSAAFSVALGVLVSFAFSSVFWQATTPASSMALNNNDNAFFAIPIANTSLGDMIPGLSAGVRHTDAL
jgi:hypothetical protein